MTKLQLFWGNYKKFPGHAVCKIGILFLLTLLLNLTGYAQQVEIRGKILDEGSKLSVIGATIKLKGLPGGAVSNVDGDFQVNVKALPVTLLVSNIGYKYQEIDVYEAEPITIFLAEDQNRLSSVVVVGYGTQKRSELTGSVSSLPVDKLKQAGPSFESALQGAISGVQVTQTSGAPGSGVSIRIRGGNSITGGNDPLYVIDGFPIYNNSNESNAGALNSQAINPLSSINPGDIESVDVLKDASATAIYGSRGANGVVIITTKKGKAGVNKVTYDGSLGVQTASKKIDQLNAKEWATLKNDARANSGKAPLFSAAQLDSLGSAGTDWQSAALRSATIQNHNLSFTGGNEKTHYSISTGYLKQDGILIGTDFSRFSSRVSLDSKISNKFTVGINLNGSKSDASQASFGNVQGVGDNILSILYMPPTVPIRTKTGAYTFASPYESAVANPIATLNLATNLNTNYRLLGTIYGEYKIIEGLKAKVLFGTDILANKQNRYLPSSLYEGASVGGIATVGSKFTNRWLNENTLTYNKTFSDVHNVEALVGLTQESSKSEGVIASSQGFINDILQYNDLYSGSTTNKSYSSYSGYSLLSYLGRVNYNYKQTYFLTASVRRDGTSRLGVNSKWGNFPSAAIAWKVNKESFFQPLSETVSNLKLRFGAGKTGNSEIVPYQSLSLLSVYSYPTGSGTTTNAGYAPARVANPDLKWETTAQYDGGIDLGLFKDRINLIFDAYYKKTTDLLLDVQLPYTSGFASAYENYGSVENKGIELGLNTENFKGKFGWNTNVIFSLNRNKVLSLGNGLQSYVVTLSGTNTAAIVQVGQPLGSFYGYKADGVFKSTDNISTTPRIDQTGTKPGDVRYKDISGPNGKPDGIISQAYDRALIGNAQPKFTFGFTNNFTYAHFDLSVSLSGSIGNKIYSNILQQLQLTTGFQNGIKGLTDHWTAANENAQYPRANENVPTTPNSDLYVYDGSYVRLKNISFGYNFPKRIVAKLKISNLRLYVSAQNLKTWTSYKGYDPEVNYYEGNSALQGIDYSAYPTAKTVTGGLSVTF